MWDNEIAVFDAIATYEGTLTVLITPVAFGSSCNTITDVWLHTRNEIITSVIGIVHFSSCNKVEGGFSDV